MNVVATYIPAVPMRCRMPKTIWEGRKRSAIMPTKNGLIIPAIDRPRGPAKVLGPKANRFQIVGPVTCHAPQIKN